MSDGQLQAVCIEKEERLYTKRDFRAWLEWNSGGKPGEFQRNVDKLISYFDSSFDEFIEDIKG